MDFNTFTEYVKEHLREYIPKEEGALSYEIVTKLKGNGQKMTGIEITGEGNVVPVIYLEGFHERFQSGMKLKHIMQQIAECYAYKPEHVTRLIMDDFSFETCRDKIIAAVRNREMNLELFKDVPKEEKGDFALVYYVHLKSPDVRGNILITNDILKHWGIEKEALKKAAWENMYREHEPVFLPMNQLLGMEAGEEDFVTMDYVKYVVTSKDRWEGAVYLFDEAFMENVSERFGSDIFVIPASVHDVILLKMGEHIWAEAQRDIMRNINQRMSAPWEVLSNEVYVLKYGTQTLVNALEKSVQCMEKEHEEISMDMQM